MSKKKKRLDALRETSQNVAFSDLVSAILSVGFTERRQNGSHRIFRHDGFPEEIIDIQEVKGNAKAYQVDQFLDIVDRCKLEIV